MQIVDASTVKLDATYTEPTKSVDGVLISDLSYTSIYYQVGTQTPVKVPQVPATKPQGGGSIATSVLFPLAAGQRSIVKFWVTATDLTGNESNKSNEVTLNLERVSPDAPLGFTIG
jgi:hypothetical protein